jgi:hypothetical protein
MQATKLRDPLGASLRAMAPADFDNTMSMWDLLSAVERAEHEHMLRPQADAWAAQRLQHLTNPTTVRQITARATSRS